MSNATMAAPATFGGLLKLLRKRAHLTQRDLGIAVGYSEAYITRLEGNSRLPDPIMVKARFVDALALHDEPRLAQQLFDLAMRAHTSKLAVMSKPGAEPGTNLATPLTRFIGRQADLHNVIDLVQRHRLVTLTGSGGVGKTRLATEAGLSLLNHFEAGVQIVELAPIGEAAQVAQTVAGVFKIANPAGHAFVDALCVLLAGKHLLFIVDNCEHVIQACAELVEALLHACPSLHILATSREALNIPGEMAWRVPSMNAEEAAELFAERAQVVKADFVLDAQNAGEVEDICTHLDGIPLAIELAASRLSGLSVKQLAARLDDRFTLLTNGSRTALKPHQTLRALIAWSHDLLSDQERTLLRRLAVFAGGWTAEAAEEVCATPIDSDSNVAALFSPNVLPLLLGLVNKSLVISNDEGDETRFSMLETIRQFAWEQLERAGESSAVQSRHAQYCLAYLKRTAPAKTRETDFPFWEELISLAGLAWVKNMLAERDNLRTALVWSLQQAHDVDIGIQLALWQQFMWEISGPRDEGRAWLTLALSHTNASEPTQLRARVLVCLSNFTFRMGDREKATNFCKEALLIFRRLNDQFGIMHALHHLADINFDDSDRDRDMHDNTTILHEWLAIARKMEDPVFTGAALWYLGIHHANAEELTHALEYYAESLRSLPEDETCLRHTAKYFQAIALRKAGTPEGTLESIHEALAVFRLFGFVLGIFLLLRSLGDDALAQGDIAKAQVYLHEGLDAGYRDGAKQFSVPYFVSMAALAAAQNKCAEAVTLAAANISLGGPTISEPHLHLIDAARSQLDAPTLASAEAAGRRMTYDQAVAFALAL